MKIGYLAAAMMLATGAAALAAPAVPAKDVEYRYAREIQQTMAVYMICGFPRDELRRPVETFARWSAERTIDGKPAMQLWAERSGATMRRYRDSRGKALMCSVANAKKRANFITVANRAERGLLASWGRE